MPKDDQLEKLGAARDRAFERKQTAWDAQDRAWKKREAAKVNLDRAHQDQQSAFDAQNAVWQQLDQIKRYNSPRIDQLNAQHDAAFERMKTCFDDASRAHSSRDGASAKRYADNGHSYKAEMQGYVAERRRLFDEIRQASDRLKSCKPNTQRAKANFQSVKSTYDHAKAEHEHARAAFLRAKTEFENAKLAFQSRLATLKSETEKRKSDKKSLAVRAGVPSQYHNDVYMTKKTDGTTHFYFGGVGSPDGAGHGHYVMESTGSVSYRREPFDPHGSQNHTDNHKGGFEPPQHGYVDGKPVTFASGWGSNQGHTLLADGHLSDKDFLQKKQHNHYGSGDGKSNNARDRGKYTGPNS